MKKIMFNDKFGLTQAVLEGRKTMTRRLIKASNLDEDSINLCKSSTIEKHSKYKVGETVAVAQSYYTIEHSEVPARLYLGGKESGVFNKMFVKAEFMPHKIRITDIKVEHLQDISDEDCLAEGVGRCKEQHIIGHPFGVSFNYYIKEDSKGNRYSTPREAFATLIDKISGKGTWDSNPYVFVYEFELLE